MSHCVIIRLPRPFADLRYFPFGKNGTKVKHLAEIPQPPNPKIKIKDSRIRASYLILAFLVLIYLTTMVGMVSSRHRNIAKFFYNDVFRVVLPEHHRFPMEKYRMVREGLQSRFSSDNRVLFMPSPLSTPAELQTTHCPQYIERYLSGNLTLMEIRRVGFPWSIAGVQRTISSVGGTVAAMRAVCGEDSCCVSGHVAGGTHHAFYDYGEVLHFLSLTLHHFLVEHAFYLHLFLFHH